MWAFLKKWFKASEIEPLQKESTVPKGISASSVVQKQQNNQFDVCDNYDYGFSHKQLSDFELLVLNLRSYSGYIRESTLKQIQDHYDSELFPYILERLSDYVDVNRKLAIEHIVQWSQQDEFSQLCINHFLDIAALQFRDRTDRDTLNLLLSEIAKNKTYLSEILISKQGKLPRVLLNFILQYQWISENETLELCRLAKDQKLREYWLDCFIMNNSDDELLFELKRNSYRDVQYRLFDVLYQKNVLSVEDLVLFWHSKFPSIMDYAYFALRKKNFDFNHYFIEHSIGSLTSSEARIRAKQWLLMKGDTSIFFDLLIQMNSREISNSIIFLALKQQYLNLDQCLDYYHQTQQKLEFWHLSKLKKVYPQHIGLDELQKYLSLVDTPITIKQRLSLVDGYSIWDRLYWFVSNHQYIQTDEDQSIFDLHIAQHLPDLVYAIYGEQWTSSQKAKMQTLLPTFIQSYPDIFENEKIRGLLKPYLK